ncbi:MAG: hypothetical protein PHG14_15685 [Desulfobacter postgatei]|uniref:hypothetical protein n=1 Tax=Desulfobacter postgatei TaxID=2293 RepID=UPI0023EF5D05|nr:hypothetical protein [Desulfobacter postgatei]MDD4275157.1 hypothetical protein [Desulfobacter postgatei]
MWLACETLEEISDEIGLTRDEVRGILGNMENLPKSPKFSFSDDSFTPPIYNVWKLQTKSNKVFEMWLACETLESIADNVGINKQTVTNWVDDFSKNLTAKDLAKFNFKDDFQIPIYNVWKLNLSQMRQAWRI